MQTMTEDAVVDASVVAKWFIEERGTPKALEVQRQFVSGELNLHAPILMPYEVLNALKYSRLFKKTELRELATALMYYRFKLEAPDKRMLVITASIASETGFTIYDAAYLALATTFEWALYTSDAELARAAKKLDSDLEVHEVSGNS